MAILAMSLTNGTLTIVRSTDANVETISVRNDDARWNPLMEAYKDGNDANIEKLLSLAAVVEQYSEGNLTVNDTGVYYRGNLLHTLDAQRIMEFVKGKIPFERYARFVARKLKNPSARAIAEMYKFLENKYMPLTPQGTFIAYKGVRRDYFSVTGNTKTVVLQGEVDTEGHILNRVGDTIEIERSSCDDDYRNCCSFGLHAGSLEYATGFGDIVILVEIDPADVVSVPEEGKAHKLRCCKYKVVGVYTGPLPSHYTNEFATCNDEYGTCDGSGEDCNGCVDCNGDDECDGEDDCGCDACLGETDESDTHDTISDGEGDFWGPPVPPADSNELVKSIADDLANHPHWQKGYIAGFEEPEDPKYLSGDENGADSYEHRLYIIGYLNGYEFNHLPTKKEG